MKNGFLDLRGQLSTPVNAQTKKHASPQTTMPQNRFENEGNSARTERTTPLHAKLISQAKRGA